MPDSPKLVSAKQLAANRANAARSTGPRTPEGKARSAGNAVKHGFTASSFNVVRLEDLQEIAHLKEDLVSVYQPVNAQELFALERMALAQQSILRAARLEAGLFTTCLNETLSPRDIPYIDMSAGICENIEITRQQNRNFLLAEGFQIFTKHQNSWTLFLRYQVQAERLYRRSLEEFERLKRLRPELPNEPILECEPEETQPLYTRVDVGRIDPPDPPVEPPASPSPSPDPPSPPVAVANPSSPLPPERDPDLEDPGNAASAPQPMEPARRPRPHSRISP